MYINIKIYFTKMLILLLSASIIMQNNVIFAQKTQPNTKLVNVGYLGESLININEKNQSYLSQKLLGTLNQNYYEFYDSQTIDKKTKLTPISFDSNENELKAVLNEIAINVNLDYVFVSVFENIAPQNERPMLKGKVFRYNLSSNEIFNYEILSYIEDLDMHMKNVKNRLVENIPRSVYGMKKNRNFLLLGVLLVVGMALNQSFEDLGKYLNPGSSGGSSTDPGGTN
tara:strand:- start:3319 stop:3999 length:681 start_codon:yes stop_codon:yes gene_type:complete